MTKRLLLLLTVALAVSCQTADTEEQITRFEQAIYPTFTIKGEDVDTAPLAEKMKEYGVPGVSVAVIDKGRIAWARGYGFADLESKRRVTTETLFQAASVSKPVSALAALDMAEEGMLALDADVNRYLESWKVPENDFTRTEKVTLRRILNHTAGTTVWGFPGYVRGDSLPGTADVLSGRGNTDPVTVFKEPGASWRYSGGGYTVMQLMMSDVAQQPFPELMRARVLEPAGMDHSTYRQPLPDSLHGRAATGYRSDGAEVEGDWHVYPEMAAAGLWTTPSDLARYVLEVQRSYRGAPDAILEDSTARVMLTPGMNHHGLGPGISDDSLRFGHGGANEGFRCRFSAYIREGRGVVVMTNSDNGGPLTEQIIATLGKLYGWEGMGPEEKVLAELDADAYRAVTGRYRFDMIGEVEVSMEGDTLRVRGDNIGGRPELLPVSATEFFLREDGTPVRFELEDGRAARMVIAGSLKGARIDQP